MPPFPSVSLSVGGLSCFSCCFSPAALGSSFGAAGPVCPGLPAWASPCASPPPPWGFLFFRSVLVVETRPKDQNHLRLEDRQTRMRGGWGHPHAHTNSCMASGRLETALQSEGSVHWCVRGTGALGEHCCAVPRPLACSRRFLAAWVWWHVILGSPTGYRGPSQ